MNILSDDLFFYLFKFLNTIDLINLKRTCKKMYNLLHTKNLSIDISDKLKNIEHICDHETFISVLISDSNNEIDDEFFDLTIIKNGNEIELGEYDDHCYRLPDKYRIYNDIIFMSFDKKIVIYNLKDPRNPLYDIRTSLYCDFEIYDKFLILTTGNKVLFMDIKDNFNLSKTYSITFKNVIVDEEVIIFHDHYNITYFDKSLIKNINHEFVVDDRIDTIKVYQREMYLIFLYSDIVVYSLETKEMVRTFDIKLCELYKEKLIQFHNNYIYCIIPDDNAIYVYKLNGTIKYKLHFKTDHRLSEGSINDLYINKKTGEIMFSFAYDDIRMIS
jgi:hypothetical protein